MRVSLKRKLRKLVLMDTENDNVRSLRSLITYGIKGIGAYSKHANALLKDNPEIDAFIQKALAATLRDDISVDNLVSLALEVGKKRCSRYAASRQGKYRRIR